MTPTMLERAAMALALLQGAEWDARSAMETPGGEDPDEMRSGFFDQVRAVLMAVRVPSDAMSKAARTTEGWEDMIDAILNEPTR